MLHRRLVPAIARVLTLTGAAIAVAGLQNCASYPSAARDGTLSAILSSPSRPSRSKPTASLGAILSGAPGTYIEELLEDRDSTIERWPDHVVEPLRVWIDSSTMLTGVQTYFPDAVRAAFAEWASTGIPLRFAFISSPRDADIRVHWTNHLDHKTGSTTWRTDRTGWLTNGDITLATHISDGQPLDARGMRAIALHEVGHALGLSHSADGHDIMAPLVRVDGLSIPDRNTIKLLYSFPAGGPVH
ncbi:MAG TPA: matrixin family metalloprotease [Gemmatimonadaceae bacterium]|nr:matrixin family metalloprotease [Gemmatimonadaceae bacterium]